MCDSIGLFSLFRIQNHLFQCGHYGYIAFRYLTTSVTILALPCLFYKIHFKNVMFVPTLIESSFIL